MLLLFTPGRVGMEECSLDLLFLKLGTDHLVPGEESGCFLPTAKIRFSDKVKAFIFCNHKSI